MNRHACATLVGILTAVTHLRGANSPWPDQIRSNLTAAVQATKRYIDLADAGTAVEGLHEQLRQSSLFAQAIDRLGKVVDEGTAAAAASEDTIETKLIAIAYDRAQKPHDFEEIEDLYANAIKSEIMRRPKELGYPGPRPISPALRRPQHCQEKYRLAWEYLLITPRLTNALDLYDYRARDAIAQIKNEKSLITLEYSFAVTAGTPAGPAFRLPQELALATMTAFPTEKGLESLLRCVALADRQPKKAESSTEEWDVEKRVHELLTAGSDPAYHQRWKPVLQGYSAKADALPEKQRRFLQRVNETLAKDRKP